MFDHRVVHRRRNRLVFTVITDLVVNAIHIIHLIRQMKRRATIRASGNDFMLQRLAENACALNLTKQMFPENWP